MHHTILILCNNSGCNFIYYIYFKGPSLGHMLDYFILCLINVQCPLVNMLVLKLRFALLMHCYAHLWTSLPAYNVVVHGTGHTMAHLRIVWAISRRMLSNRCCTFLPAWCFFVTTLQPHNVSDLQWNVVKKTCHHFPIDIPPPLSFLTKE